VASNWEVLSQHTWAWSLDALAWAWVAYNASLLLSVVGWQGIMRSVGVGLSFICHWEVCTFTNIARRLPTAFWYASGRLLMYERLGVAKTATSMALAVEIFITLYAGSMVSILLSLIQNARTGWQERPWLLAILVVGAVLLSRPQAIMAWLNRTMVRLGWSSVEMHLRRYDVFPRSCVLVLNWISGGVMLYFLIRGLYQVQALDIVGVVYMWTVSGVVAIALTTLFPVSFGPREVTLTVMLSSVVPAPVAAALAILSRVWLGLNQLLWFGLSFVVRTPS